MTDETLINTAYFDEKGNLKKGFVPLSKVNFYNDNPEKKWTDELEAHKKQRIVRLQETLEQTEAKLKEELSDWDRLRYSLFRDQLMIDLREDKLHVQYKGDIPKVINDRCVRKSEAVHSRYEKAIGRQKLLELINDINVSLWGCVIIGDTTTGGGKV